MASVGTMDLGPSLLEMYQSQQQAQVKPSAQPAPSAQPNLNAKDEFVPPANDSTGANDALKGSSDTNHVDPAEKTKRASLPKRLKTFVTSLLKDKWFWIFIGFNLPYLAYAERVLLKWDKNKSFEENLNNGFERDLSGKGYVKAGWDTPLACLMDTIAWPVRKYARSKGIPIVDWKKMTEFPLSAEDKVAGHKANQSQVAAMRAGAYMLGLLMTKWDQADLPRTPGMEQTAKAWMDYMTSSAMYRSGKHFVRTLRRGPLRHKSEIKDPNYRPWMSWYTGTYSLTEVTNWIKQEAYFNKKGHWLVELFTDVNAGVDVLSAMFPQDLQDPELHGQPYGNT